jgi:hypothetical protein
MDVLHAPVRSFASKYLHFHAPRAVPIYDAYANVRLKRYVGSSVRVPDEWEGVGDEKYSRFVARYLMLYEEIDDRFGIRLAPKEIDRLLWKLPSLSL